jgi:hypothetical protein
MQTQLPELRVLLELLGFLLKWRRYRCVLQHLGGLLSLTRYAVSGYNDQGL